MADATFSSLPTTIFDVMSGLARAHDAVNLGQGFPDDPGPQDVREKAAEALLTGSNQYPPMSGLPVLREAVAAHYLRHQALSLDWPTEVLITSGATEALAASFLALIEPGDEVLVFQPAYDAYLPLIRRAGGIAKAINLAPPDWRLDPDAISAAIGPRVRFVVLNNPLNPAAAVYDAAALAPLAQICVRHGLVAICDEVWEHVVFDGRTHCPLMSLPGMRERCVKIGSAGKIFSLTGWKVGFVMAPPALLSLISKAHQFLTFTTPPNLQLAVAHGLAKDREYFSGMRARLARARDRLAAGLTAEGYRVLPSAGTYFSCIDLPASGVPVDDVTFARRAVVEAGVAVIPVSAFYAGGEETRIARLCFAKADATIAAGIARLGAARRLFV